MAFWAVFKLYYRFMNLANCSRVVSKKLKYLIMKHLFPGVYVFVLDYTEKFPETLKIVYKFD